MRDTLQQWYLWYDQLPDPDPAGFDSPEAYLQAVRYQPLDSSFSYIADQAASDAFYSTASSSGSASPSGRVSATELRVTQVFAGGPAAVAGLARGDYVVTIGGDRGLRAPGERADRGEPSEPSESGVTRGHGLAHSRGAGAPGHPHQARS